MKKLLLILFICFGCATLASAATYRFTAPDRDIFDLDHHKYYAWEISNFSLTGGEYVTGATLSFYDIYNWTRETDDKLYIHLLDSVPGSISLSVVDGPDVKDAIYGTEIKSYTSTLYQGHDSQGGGDNFAGLGTLLTPVWSDPDDNATDIDLVYDLAALGGTINPDGTINPGNISIIDTLIADMADGVWAFALDPDCHYFNRKVKFTITTAVVPEPATILLLGGGLVGLAFAARRRKKE